MGSRDATGAFRDDTALLSEVLADNGYNTYCVGKWHLTPLEESNLLPPNDIGRCRVVSSGFYGFMGGETDQWYPELVYDNHPIAPRQNFQDAAWTYDRRRVHVRDAR